jgi:hypothetical protein
MLTALGIVLQIGCQKAGQPPANNAPTPSPSHSISGQLNFVTGPITDASASLALYKDQQCVELGAKNDRSPAEQEQLNDCMKKDIVKVVIDEKGNYKLIPPNPGLYKLWIRWWSDKTLGGGTSGFRDVGDFQILYAEKKNEPGKVLFVAVSKPFHFTGQEDVVKHLNVPK